MIVIYFMDSMILFMFYNNLDNCLSICFLCQQIAWIQYILLCVKCVVKRGCQEASYIRLARQNSISVSITSLNLGAESPISNYVGFIRGRVDG